jgi:hypothetical protein
MDADPRLKQCGFAKLEGILDGREIVHFVTKYEVILGRSSKSSAVDVVLGAPSNVMLASKFNSHELFDMIVAYNVA